MPPIFIVAAHVEYRLAIRALTRIALLALSPARLFRMPIFMCCQAERNCFLIWDRCVT